MRPGNTILPKAYNNILKVYQMIQKHIDAFPDDASRFPNFKQASGYRPIYSRGAAGPIKGAMNLAEYFHGPDGLSDITTTHPEHAVNPATWNADNPYLELSEKPAHQVILDILDKEPAGTVVVLSVGPLTNISKAISQSPSTFAKARRLVSMGGTLDVPGNTSATSEFNFFADPYAAQHVLDHVQQIAQPYPFDFVLVPLDVTSRHTIPYGRLISERESSPLQEFTSALLRRPRGVMKVLGLPDEFEMHDPLAAWFVIRTCGDGTPEPGWGVKKRKFVVEKTGEYTKGMCVVDRRGGTNEVAATTRAVEGIVVKDEKERERESTNGKAESEGVNVLSKWPDTSIFIKEMMRRVFPIES
ncbi:hypothetical protein FRB98_001097 [Tulasnella sp. 332]|nr:hypothetical protein FRB98_001097 [Tulasnella sp. 332]